MARGDDGGVGVKLKASNGQLLSGSSLWNVSLGGVFVEMDEPIAFGQELSCEFELQKQTLRCRGFVVWSSKTSPEKSTQKGVAVRLADLSIAEMRTLAEQIGRKLPLNLEGDAA